MYPCAWGAISTGNVWYIQDPLRRILPRAVRRFAYSYLSPDSESCYPGGDLHRVSRPSRHPELTTVPQIYFSWPCQNSVGQGTRILLPGRERQLKRATLVPLPQRTYIVNILCT